MSQRKYRSLFHFLSCGSGNFLG